jgi:hypothetical protein
MNELPELVTHNYDPKRGPFRNICDLPRTEAESLLAEMASSGGRTFKANYLSRRLATEEWLRSEKSRKLGATRLARPIYFFLGDFADGRDASRPASILMPLSEFPPDVVTFTYPDSMASLAIACLDDHIADRRDYHGRVFTFQELAGAVSRHGIPGQRWKTNPTMRYDRFIEMQLWDDRPIGRLQARSH